MVSACLVHGREKCRGICLGHMFSFNGSCYSREWVKHKVPITHIHRCHLLDYEHQIVSVVLSHCRYSLKLGEAHTVHYDHQALEKHILDKFIYGKPIILSDIPQVVYRRDIYTTVTFNQVRKNVRPQVSRLVCGTLSYSFLWHS